MGGNDNYLVDRRAGDEVAREYPEIFDLAHQGREFQLRVVRYLAGERDIDQVLDVGTGYPMGYMQYQNTHEIVHSLHPEGRVLYVDNDPVVLAHARARLTAWQRTGV
ncbi:MAG: SAM-dependent methyltransferase, partial [Pseudonocardia sp.]|nr:SAM-dependent methyltransferase [Pseudonocardia sp.]